MLALGAMARSKLLLGYLEALGHELDAAAALADRPVDELEADPRLRSQAVLRLGRILDAVRDIAALQWSADTPRRPAFGAIIDGLAEGDALPGPVASAVMPLLQLARLRSSGALDLDGLNATRLRNALAATSRLRRWGVGA